MIITLIVIGIIIGAIVCCIIERKINSNWSFMLAFALSAFALFTSLIVGIALIANYIDYDIDYQNVLHKREMIEYRIENIDDNIVGNEMLYNNIVDFNNSLRSVKKWANNPWVNWFYNKDIAEIDYITITLDDN